MQEIDKMSQHNHGVDILTCNFPATSTELATNSGSDWSVSPKGDPYSLLVISHYPGVSDRFCWAVTQTCYTHTRLHGSVLAAGLTLTQES